MEEHSANPYAAPRGEVVAPEAGARGNWLTPLWIWLFVAVAASFFATPADPTSVLIALGNGLLCFLVGAVFGSSAPWIVRIVPMVLWGVPAVALAVLDVGVFFIPIELFYCVASIAIGYWACRSISRGRFRIIFCFATGYVVGTVLGLIGVAGGAVVGAILANRSMAES